MGAFWPSVGRYFFLYLRFFVFIRKFFIFFSRISSSLLLLGCKVLWYYEFDMHSSVKTPCDVIWLQAGCIGFVRTSHWCIKPGIMSFTFQWSWSYGSWIYNYLCNQCLLPLKLWVRTRSWRGVLETTLCNKVCNCAATGRWFSPVLSTNKNDCHDITEILLKVALNTINQPMHWVFIIVINYRSCLLDETNPCSYTKFQRRQVPLSYWRIIERVFVEA